MIVQLVICDDDERAITKTHVQGVTQAAAGALRHMAENSGPIVNTTLCRAISMSAITKALAEQ